MVLPPDVRIERIGDPCIEVGVEGLEGVVCVCVCSPEGTCEVSCDALCD